ncbi:hypothetical protein ES703_122269 [subsurface metagenome]
MTNVLIAKRRAIILKPATVTPARFIVPIRGSSIEILGRGKIALIQPSTTKPTETVIIKNSVASPPLTLIGVRRIRCTI